MQRRHLPHYYTPGEPLFVTFRLYGCRPNGRAFGGRLDLGKAFACMDRLLDEQRAGPAFLKIAAIANVVVDSIRAGAATDYLLHAWVVMPNHVHLLITPHVDASAALHRLKGASARQSNLLLGRTGQPFWQAEATIVSSVMLPSSIVLRTISFKTRCAPAWFNRQRNTHGRAQPPDVGQDSSCGGLQPAPRPDAQR